MSNGAFERADAIRKGEGEHVDVINDLRNGFEQVLSCVNNMLERVNNDETFRTVVMQQPYAFLSIDIPGSEYSLIYHQAFQACGTVLSSANDDEKRAIIKLQNLLKERYDFSWTSSMFFFDQKSFRIYGDGMGKNKSLLFQHLKEAFPDKRILT